MYSIDLFAGVGGFTEGLKNANIECVLANEIDATIAESYTANHPSVLMINESIDILLKNFDSKIKKLSKDQGINHTAINKKLKEIDLIVGGPPCQGFSMAGARNRKSHNFIKDPRNQLFKKYFELVQKFEPSFFIFENVVGIKSMGNGQILSSILSLFDDNKNFSKGKYFMQQKVFSSDNLGIPQKRKRFIIIGSKKPFDLVEVETKLKNELKITNKYFFENSTVRDAISDLEKIKPYIGRIKTNPNTNYQKRLSGNSDFTHNHNPLKHSETVLRRIKMIEPGENFKNLPKEENIKSIHSGSYGRLSWDSKSNTITTRFDTPSAGRFIHPSLNRNITIREAARLQSFPDNYRFLGNKTSVHTQIGNAVPPQLAEYLGLVIKKIYHEYYK